MKIDYTVEDVRDSAVRLVNQSMNILDVIEVAQDHYAKDVCPDILETQVVEIFIGVYRQMCQNFNIPTYL